MKNRILVNGKKVKELKKPFKWEFESKCPDKWIHIDCEDSSIYVKNSKSSGLFDYWKRATLDQLEAALKCVKWEINSRKES